MILSMFRFLLEAVTFEVSLSELLSAMSKRAARLRGSCRAQLRLEPWPLASTSLLSQPLPFKMAPVETEYYDLVRA